jgi:cytochrome c oxidase subunit II
MGMPDVKPNSRPLRVLIASANLLFGRGLRRLFQDRWGDRATIVGLTTTLEETLSAVENLKPDLVILDYDDHSIYRERFLNYYVTGERPMQVALISLRDSGAVVVYDRKMLTPSQAEDWLNMPWLSGLRSSTEQSQEN